MSAAVLSLFLGFLTLVSAAPSARTTCNNYVIISARGTGEPQGPSAAFTSMIQQTLTAVPGGMEYDTVYNASQDQPQVGTDDIVRYINQGIVSCPSQRYVLLGYSQGATATNGALTVFNNPASPAYKAIAASLVVGNPSHKANQQANVDQSGGKSTNPFYGVLYWLRARIPDVWYQSSKVLDICYQDDLVCVGFTPTSGFQNHVKYGSTASVQQLGAQFLKQKLSS